MAYSYWLEEIELLSESSQYGYKRYFNLFCEWLNKTPEELYTWQKTLIADDDPRTNRDIVREYVKWYREMQEIKNWKGATALRASYAIRSFFTANALPFPLRKNDLPHNNSQGARVVLLDEIRQILSFVGGEFRVRNRALILMLKDSGLRRSDVSSMNVEDYHGSTLIDTENGEFRVFKDGYRTQKTGELAYIHLGPESIKAIDIYLADRTTGPLFLNRKGKRMFVGNMTTMVKRFARHLLDSDHISPHSFRKTHRTLLESRMPESYIKKLQGKSSDVYSHPEQTGDLTRAYVEHYQVICLDDNSEIREMRKEQNAEMADIRAKMDRMEKMFVEVFDNPAALEETKRRLERNI